MAADSAQRSQLWTLEAGGLCELDDSLDEFASEHLPEKDANRICGFKRCLARRRALLSHLLQRHACCTLGQIPLDQVQIERTKGGKPYLAVDPAAHCPNFNFNASHDGEYVVLAASTHFLTGVDVHKVLSNEALAEMDCGMDFLEMQFTAAQQQLAEAMSPDERRIWTQALFSAKEAYTKAIGVGLGQDFSLTEFEPPLPSTWGAVPVVGVAHAWKGRVHLLGEAELLDQGEWCLELQWVDADHMVVTAMGDVAWAVDENGDFASRLTRPGLCPHSREEGSCGEAWPVCLRELLSPQELTIFASAGSADSDYTDTDRRMSRRMSAGSEASYSSLSMSL